jgi:hypothetical protein
MMIAFTLRTGAARRAVDPKYEAYAFVNNRTEGFAPGTIEAVAQRPLF